MLWRAEKVTHCLRSWTGELKRCHNQYSAKISPAPSLAVCPRYFRSTSHVRLSKDDDAVYSVSEVLARLYQVPSEAVGGQSGPPNGVDLTSQPPSQSLAAAPDIASDESPSHTSLRPLFFRHDRLAPLDRNDGVRPESQVRMQGLVQSIRKQKKAAFAHVSDGSTLESFQAVLSPEQATEITNGCYVDLIGVWQESSGGGQASELQVDRVCNIGLSAPDRYPIQKKYQSQEFLRTFPHLRLRTPFNSLMTRARSHIRYELLRSLDRRASLQVQPPLITSSDCEGAGEVFTLSPRTAVPSASTSAQPQQYFREPRYLTVSAQLHLEAYCAQLGDVYAFSPVFRAEESDTSRHLSEFYMLEVEYRSKALRNIMVRVEASIRWVVQQLRASSVGHELLRYHADPKHDGDETRVDLEERWRRLERRSDTSREGWQNIEHQQAVDQLLSADAASNGALFETKPSHTTGLQLEHERWIVENLGGGNPVFVTHYPKAAKPFYMLPSPYQNSTHGVQTVACFDLLFPFGYCEIAGGSLREHRLENLISNMRERGMLKKRDPRKPAKESEYPYLQPDEDLGNLRWYTDLRRFGSSPHGGYGLGFDRLLAYLTGVSNVRDVVAFPRTWGRADC